MMRYASLGAGKNRCVPHQRIGEITVAQRDIPPLTGRSLTRLINRVAAARQAKHGIAHTHNDRSLNVDGVRISGSPP
jgi:hypothetical protein